MLILKFNALIKRTLSPVAILKRACVPCTFLSDSAKTSASYGPIKRKPYPPTRREVRANQLILMHFSNLVLSFSIYGLISLSNSAPSTSAPTFSNGQQWYCFSGGDWTKPDWPANVHFPLSAIIRRLEQGYVRQHPQIFEFLPIGETPTWGWATVRTPFKLSLGESSSHWSLQSSSGTGGEVREVSIHL